MIPIAKPNFGEDEMRAVREVLESGIVIQGPKVALFEKRFARYVGVRHAIAVNSGTAALHVALLAHGIKGGQEVLIPPLTFFATASAAVMCGARPVFADVEQDTYTMSPKDAREALGPRVAAIIPVHLYGQAADMEPLVEMAHTGDAVAIEDAAQAHGATYRGKNVGSLGDTACFSFYATKTMTTGEGGMVVTNDDEVADRCRLLRDHGQSSKYKHVMLGHNYRMTEIAAAIGLVQLQRLGSFIEQRRENAAFMTDGFREVRSVAPPVEAPGRLHTYYQYILRLEKDFPRSRDELIRLLSVKGISSRPSYPVPLYRQEALKGKVRVRRCKVAESVLPRLLELPVYPGVPKEGLETAVEVIRAVAKR